MGIGVRARTRVILVLIAFPRDISVFSPCPLIRRVYVMISCSSG